MQRLLGALDKSDNHASISINSGTNNIRILLNRHHSGQYLIRVIQFWLLNWDANYKHQTIFKCLGNQYIRYILPNNESTRAETNYLINLQHKLTSSSSITLNPVHKQFLYKIVHEFIENERTLKIHN